MDIKPIRTKADYKRALREVSAYFNDEPEPGSEDGDRFEILTTLVEPLKRSISPSKPPTPSKRSASAWNKAVCR